MVRVSYGVSIGIQHQTAIIVATAVCCTVATMMYDIWIAI